VESVHDRAVQMGNDEFKTKGALAVYSQILEREPENEPGLLFLFNKYKAVNPEKAGGYFVRLLTRYVKKDMPRALSLVDDYFPAHLNLAPGEVLLKLGLHYLRIQDLKKARLCLELATQKKGPWQAKAMLFLSKVYLKMQLPERAECLYERIVEVDPHTEIGQEAWKRLTKILESHG
jgi:tetratricopeptide (TPR) repeat protein